MVEEEEAGDVSYFCRCQYLCILKHREVYYHDNVSYNFRMYIRFWYRLHHNDSTFSRGFPSTNFLLRLRRVINFYLGRLRRPPIPYFPFWGAFGAPNSLLPLLWRLRRPWFPTFHLKTKKGAFGAQNFPTSQKFPYFFRRQADKQKNYTLN